MKDQNTVKVADPSSKVLSYVSANEINFIAFNLATEEYHNELYEMLKLRNGLTKGIKQFDNDFFHAIKGESKNSPWMGNPNEVTKHTFIRNQIHNQAENGKTAYTDLLNSIEKMRGYLI